MRINVTSIGVVPKLASAVTPPAVIALDPELITVKIVVEPFLKSKPLPPPFASQLIAQ